MTLQRNAAAARTVATFKEGYAIWTRTAHPISKNGNNDPLLDKMHFARTKNIQTGRLLEVKFSRHEINCRAHKVPEIRFEDQSDKMVLMLGRLKVEFLVSVMAPAEAAVGQRILLL